MQSVLEYTEEEKDLLPFELPSDEEVEANLVRWNEIAAAVSMQYTGASGTCSGCAMNGGSGGGCQPGGGGGCP